MDAKFKELSKHSVIQIQFSSVQSFSHVWLSATPWTAARQASLSITNSQSLLKFRSFELEMPSNHLILCHPLLLLPSIFPSIRVFSNELVLYIRWPKDWSFSFSISPSNEYSGLISFRIDWFDLLAVQKTLKSCLQHHTSKASILWCPAFFMVQLSHLYMTTGKPIALTRWSRFSSVQSISHVQLCNPMNQHARPPCPSPTPGVHSNSRPLSQWCHPAISYSVVPFSSCPQSISASETFPVSQLFAWGGQSTGVSVLASFLPKNTQGWSPLEWTGWISLQSKMIQISHILKNKIYKLQPTVQLPVFVNKILLEPELRSF